MNQKYQDFSLMRPIRNRFSFSLILISDQSSVINFYGNNQNKYSRHPHH